MSVNDILGHIIAGYNTGPVPYTKLLFKLVLLFYNRYVESCNNY